MPFFTLKNASHQIQMTILNWFRIVPDLLYSVSSFTETSSPTQKLQELKGTCAFMKTGFLLQSHETTSVCSKLRQIKLQIWKSSCLIPILYWF